MEYIDGVPRFPEIKATKLSDETVFCTFQDMVDVLGEDKAIELYVLIKGEDA